MKLFARFMQLNGSIASWRDAAWWPKGPRRDSSMIDSLFGSRLSGRGGLRIATTVVSSEAGRRLRNAHASGGTAP